MPISLIMEEDSSLNTFNTLQQELRRPRDEELRHVGMQERQGKRLIDVISRDFGISIIGNIDIGNENANDQLIKYLNVATDALLLTDASGNDQQGLWAVLDFLKTRQEPIPSIQYSRILHPQQVLQAAEAGIRSITLSPEGIPIDALEDLYHSATLAGLDTIFQVESIQDIRALVPLNPQIIALCFNSITEIEDILPDIPQSAYAIAMCPIDHPEDAITLSDAGADAVIIDLPHATSDYLERFIEEIRDAAL